MYGKISQPGFFAQLPANDVLKSYLERPSQQLFKMGVLHSGTNQERMLAELALFSKADNQSKQYQAILLSVMANFSRRFKTYSVENKKQLHSLLMALLKNPSVETVSRLHLLQVLSCIARLGIPVAPTLINQLEQRLNQKKRSSRMALMSLAIIAPKLTPEQANFFAPILQQKLNDKEESIRSAGAICLATLVPRLNQDIRFSIFLKLTALLNDEYTSVQEAARYCIIAFLPWLNEAQQEVILQSVKRWLNEKDRTSRCVGLQLGTILSSWVDAEQAQQFFLAATLRLNDEFWGVRYTALESLIICASQLRTKELTEIVGFIGMLFDTKEPITDKVARELLPILVPALSNIQLASLMLKITENLDALDEWTRDGLLQLFTDWASRLEQDEINRLKRKLIKMSQTTQPSIAGQALASLIAITPASDSEMQKDLINKAANLLALKDENVSRLALQSLGQLASQLNKDLLAELSEVVSKNLKHERHSVQAQALTCFQVFALQLDEALLNQLVTDLLVMLNEKKQHWDVRRKALELVALIVPKLNEKQQSLIQPIVEEALGHWGTEIRYAARSCEAALLTDLDEKQLQKAMAQDEFHSLFLFFPYFNEERLSMVTNWLCEQLATDISWRKKIALLEGMAYLLPKLNKTMLNKIAEKIGERFYDESESVRVNAAKFFALGVDKLDDQSLKMLGKGIMHLLNDPNMGVREEALEVASLLIAENKNECLIPESKTSNFSVELQVIKAISSVCLQKNILQVDEPLDCSPQLQ